MEISKYLHPEFILELRFVYEIIFLSVASFSVLDDRVLCI